MRKTTVQQVAVSLDAFIAAPNGECDWIAMAHRSIQRALQELGTAVIGPSLVVSARVSQIDPF
jgi:hypothetical protein